MSIEVKLFEDPSYDEWRKKYWEEKTKNPDPVQKMSEVINSSVDTVIKERDKGQEVEDFFKAQIQISKDVLPPQTQGSLVQLFDQQYHRVEDFAKKSEDFDKKDESFKKKEDEMTSTTPEAFIKVYPYGNPVPQSAAMKPTSDIHKQEVDFASVEYKDQDKLSRIKQRANDKFGEKNSYVKNLWVLKTYKDEGGGLDYHGEKPKSKEIKKQVSGEEVAVDSNNQFASVEYKNKDKLSKIKQRANEKFGEKTSYVKNLWVLKTYKDEGGNVDYHGEKPKSQEIKKQISGEEVSPYCGDQAYPQGEIGTLMLDVKGGTSQWIGDHYLPKQTQDNKDKFTPPQIQLSSGWEAKLFDDGGMQDSFQSEFMCNKQETNFASTNVGELIEKVLKNLNK
jgi:hypothetical protein